MTAVKRIHVHHQHGADDIFLSFGIIGFMKSHFENRVVFKPVLESFASVLYKAKQLRKLCLRGYKKGLRYFRNFNYQNIINCPFVF